MKLFQITYNPAARDAFTSPMTHDMETASAIGWLTDEAQGAAMADLDYLEVGGTLLDEDGDRWERTA